MKIALTGNPNSGKTTMFNALTGRNERVGNWAGVTVDTREASVKSKYSPSLEVTAVDLPGAYSLSSFTGEESITEDYIRAKEADVAVNILDATNISRGLFFTTQLIELGMPTVVTLNKSDVNKKNNTLIDAEKLSEALGCPVIETDSVKKHGLGELVEAAAAVGKASPPPWGACADDSARYALVSELASAAEVRGNASRTAELGDKLDEILTGKRFGIPIFAAVMLLVFQISQVWLGKWIAEGYEFENGVTVPGLVTLLEAFQEWVGGLLADASPLISALLVDGVIGGVVAVVGFLPLVMVMYFLIALLEDCGYMARVAALLDPIFKKVGLSGKSVIPFVITVGCAVPGIMASRTIKNERERRAAALLAPFMPCGAKIPVISLFAGAFFGGSGVISTVVYLTGIALIFVGALTVKHITGAAGKRSYFIIELPDYKLPSVTGAVRSMLSRGWAYIVKAATVILVCNTAVQVMQSFTWSFSAAESADSSILASIATPFAYLLVPIVGVLSWQLAAAAVTGFIAKENVVGTLAVCFVGLENLIDTEELSLIEGAGAEAAGIIAITKAAALAYLMFNLYTPPCFAAIGAMRAEMRSAKWLAGGIALQFGFGYTAAYLVYTVGTLASAQMPALIPAVAGGAAVAVFVGCLVGVILHRRRGEASV